MTQLDLRRHQRILVPGAVEIRVAGNGAGARLEGVATVIGLGGMFVRTKSPQPMGATLKVVITCLVMSFELECSVRHVADNGCGIEFTAMTPENEEKLRGLLLRLRA